MIDDGKRQVENVLSSAIAIHSFARSCYVHASCNGDKSMIVKKRRKKKATTTSGRVIVDRRRRCGIT